MTIFAGYAAQAIANASAYERMELQSTELARQLQSQRRLLESTSASSRPPISSTCSRRSPTAFAPVVHYDNLSIYRADPANRVMVPVLTRERHAEQAGVAYLAPFGRGLMGWAVEHAEPVLANDAPERSTCGADPGHPPDPSRSRWSRS
jgi:hypothetical protein